MTVGSLFSGIGGMDLGLTWAGFDIAWQVELEDYARKVLARHWPAVPRYRDVRYFLGSKRWRRARDAWKVDLLAGGFPCQPVSLAGKRRGQDDERWLWPEFARIIRLLRPRYVLAENVPGLLVRGGTDVLRDLAALGYDAEWASLPAIAFGAPHLRWRIFIVGYANGSEWWQIAEGRNGAVGHDARRQEAADVADANSPREQQSCGDLPRGWRRAGDSGEDVADAHPGRQPGWSGEQWATGRRESADGGSSRADGVGTRLEIFPRERGDFIAELTSSQRGRQWREWWATESGFCRLADGIPNRVDRLRGGGNGVVAACAEYIGGLILQHAVRSGYA